MQRILLTGASGFIGKPLMKRLYEFGYEVAAISRDINFVFHKAKIYYCNLEDREKIVDVFVDFNPDFVIHNAALPNIASPITDLQSNVLSSVQLIDIACGFEVQKFIFASSGGAIYGEVPELHRAKVTDFLNPRSAYAIGKLTVENYLGFYQRTKNLEFCSLRYGNVIGKIKLGEKMDYILSKLIYNAAHGQPLELLGRCFLGDEGLLRDYIYLDDVIDANILALRGDIRECIINVCTGRAVSVLQIAQAVNHHFGNPSEIRFLEPRPGTIGRSVLDPMPLEQYIKPVVFETGLTNILKDI